jgi:hypothetical protein
MLGSNYEHVNCCQAHGDYFLYHKMPCVQFTWLLFWLCKTLKLFIVNIFFDVTIEEGTFDVHVDEGLILVSCNYNHGANNCLVATKAIFKK